MSDWMRDAEKIVLSFTMKQKRFSSFSFDTKIMCVVFFDRFLVKEFYEK